MKFTKKKTRTNSEISTASLPDIVFMLLFFFMVATVMRKNDMPQKIIIPKITDVSEVKIDNELRIFLPEDGVNVIVQGVRTPIDKVNQVMEQISANLTIEDKENLEVLIFADESVAMQNLYTLKLALRKNDLRRINYMANYIVTAN